MKLEATALILRQGSRLFSRDSPRWSPDVDASHHEERALNSCSLLLIGVLRETVGSLVVISAARHVLNGISSLYPPRPADKTNATSTWHLALCAALEVTVHFLYSLPLFWCHAPQDSEIAEKCLAS
jgi:hypothetical protein